MAKASRNTSSLIFGPMVRAVTEPEYSFFICTALSRAKRSKGFI
jgi:hypothetical protein